jgi:hypothetical protein
MINLSFTKLDPYLHRHYIFRDGERRFETRMTQQEQALADDKMRAEIAKLLAETKQINVNTFLAPALAAAALMGGTAALVKLFF